MGVLSVVFSAAAGACISFFIGRYVLRQFINDTFIEKVVLFKALDNSLKEKGFKLVVLLRLTPIFPYNIMNYIFSISSVSFSDYLLGCVGMFPMNMVYIYIGINLKSVS